MAGLLDGLLEMETGFPLMPDVQGGMAEGLMDGLPQLQGGPDPANPVVPNPVAQPQAPAATMASTQAGPVNWHEEAQKRPLNWQDRQKLNREMTYGSQDSTKRYYTRQAYREILNDKRSSPEARQEARLGLRFRGAPENPQDYVSNRDTMSAGGDSPSPSGTNWDENFRSTRSNDFAGLPGVFNRSTGKMEAPRRTIQENARDTQAIVDNILRQSGQTPLDPIV